MVFDLTEEEYRRPSSSSTTMAEAASGVPRSSHRNDTNFPQQHAVSTPATNAQGILVRSWTSCGVGAVLGARSTSSSSSSSSTFLQEYALTNASWLCSSNGGSFMYADEDDDDDDDIDHDANDNDPGDDTNNAHEHEQEDAMPKNADELLLESQLPPAAAAGIPHRGGRFFRSPKKLYPRNSKPKKYIAVTSSGSSSSTTTTTSTSSSHHSSSRRMSSTPRSQPTIQQYRTRRPRRFHDAYVLTQQVGI